MHVLIIAYRFPPQLGGGIHRPHKFAKYLARAGVRVTVLTIGPVNGSLPLDLPKDVRVIHLRETGPMPSLNQALNSGVSGLSRRALLLARAAAYHWMVPDDRAGFIRPVVAAGSLPEVQDGDIVLTTGGPWSDFVAGARLADRLRIPYVLDYRDPWTTCPPGWRYSCGFRTARAARSIEYLLVQKAAAVVAAHTSLPEMLVDQLRMPELQSRCHWVPNGYDPEDFRGVSPDKSDRFTLTWTGSIYGGRSLAPIFQALSELRHARQIPLEKLRIRVFGGTPEQVHAQCPDGGLRTTVDAPGLVSHREAIAAMLGSTINVLVDISYDGPIIHTPGKLYEYLAAGRPVLSISPAGVQADLIRDAHAGWVIRPGDSSGLRAALLDAYQRWEGGLELPMPAPAVVELYDRARSTAHLRELLQDIVTASKIGRKLDP